MALQPYRGEELNFFKFTSIVLNEFPKVLRQTFKTMWDNNIAHRPGYQLWDDSSVVRNLFASLEGKNNEVPTHRSYEEWDCTALFQATIYARSFALPDGKSHYKTLSDLYVKHRGVLQGSYHPSVVSPGGNNAETFALAIDQLRLLRNLICHSIPSMDTATFCQCMEHAKAAFTALGVETDTIDAVKGLTESDFPTDELRKLEQGIKEETRAYIKFLECVSSDINDLKRKMESDTANKEDIAMLEQKMTEMKKAKYEHVEGESQAYINILERMGSDIDELKRKVANKEDIALLEDKIDELKKSQSKVDVPSKMSGNNFIGN